VIREQIKLPRDEDTRARKKYVVDLTAEERTTLEHLLQKGRSSARKLVRARILVVLYR
jgi:hypothetical protein